MKVGLYFGSFNPVHIGHLIIANFAVSSTDLNQVWFVVSPQNPFKNSSGLLNKYHRLHLIKSALDGENNLKACSVEFNLPTPSYTVDTLSYLKDQFPQHEFSLLVGSDGFKNLDKWKNYEVILKNHIFYVYKRCGFDIEKKHGATIHILDAPLLQISSTLIREFIRNRKSIRFYVPDIVKEEIEKWGYYRT
jgi:nicotinate-nucleotide adenylyltransferase